MFLPGVSLKVKLLGIAVLAILTVSLIGTSLAVVNQVVAEGNGQTQFSRDESASLPRNPWPINQPINQRKASDDLVVVSALKFVCPFH